MTAVLFVTPKFGLNAMIGQTFFLSWDFHRRLCTWFNIYHLYYWLLSGCDERSNQYNKKCS